MDGAGVVWVCEAVSLAGVREPRRLVIFALAADIEDAISSAYNILASISSSFSIAAIILVSSANIMSCLRYNCSCRSLRLATLISLTGCGVASSSSAL